MPRTVHHVGGNVYTSDTALKRAWKSLAPSLSEPVNKALSALDDGGKRYIEGDLRKWYIEAAYATKYRRDQLQWTDLDAALRETRVFVARADYHNKKPKCASVRCIFFENPDGYVQPVSAESTDKARDPATYINRLLRTSIQYQIDLFRKCNRLIARGALNGRPTKLRCAVCNKCIHGESHVDHGTGTKSFRAIAADFLRTIIQAGTVDLYSRQVMDLLPRHIEDWKQFHLRRATLTLTHSKCNLTNK